MKKPSFPITARVLRRALTATEDSWFFAVVACMDHHVTPLRDIHDGAAAMGSTLSIRLLRNGIDITSAKATTRVRFISLSAPEPTRHLYGLTNAEVIPPAHEVPQQLLGSLYQFLGEARAMGAKVAA